MYGCDNPEVFDLRLSGIGIVDSYAETGIGIASGQGTLVVSSMTQGRFEVVLADPTGDRTGVQADVFAFHHASLDEGMSQLRSDGFKHTVRRIGEKGTESLDGWRHSIGVESQCRQDRRAFHKMGA